MTDNTAAGNFTCPVCHQSKPGADGTPVALLHDDLAVHVTGVADGLPESTLICDDCLNQIHGKYFNKLLTLESGELDALQHEVVSSLAAAELISDNINEAYDDKLSLGQRIADRVAAIGGSWAFIIGFGVVLCLWMTLNSLLLRREAFDPYPYILLNLVLSSLAALQAPVIMMSQNRQASKDRLRAEQDYQVNLKAELQIHHMHDMLDHLMRTQWVRMMKIQETQAQLMEELTVLARSEKPAGPVPTG